MSPSSLASPRRRLPGDDLRSWSLPATRPCRCRCAPDRASAYQGQSEAGRTAARASRCGAVRVGAAAAGRRSAAPVAVGGGQRGTGGQWRRASPRGGRPAIFSCWTLVVGCSGREGGGGGDRELARDQRPWHVTSRTVRHRLLTAPTPARCPFLTSPTGLY